MKLKDKLRRGLLPIVSKMPVNISDEIKFNDQLVGRVLIGDQYPFALIKLYDPEFKIFSKQKLKIKDLEIQILIPNHLKV